MKVVLDPAAAKYLGRLHNPIHGRILSALTKLENEPPLGDIKALAGRGGYRLRVGGYRILFQIHEDHIVVLEIGPRGSIYKGGE